jgi:hypothetical protein
MTQPKPGFVYWGCLGVCLLTLLACGWIAENTAPGGDSKKSRAQLGCKNLDVAIEQYTTSRDNPSAALPRQLSDLLQPPFGGKSFLRNGAADLIDPWGNAYQMEWRTRSDGTPFILVRATDPDGTPITQFGIGPTAEPGF